MPRDTYKYTNGEVTIVWKPNVCIHSGICIRGLPLVFDNQRRPWIDPNASDTQTMISQVKRCPSGALSFFMNDANPEAADDVAVSKSDEAAYPPARQNAILNIEITPNGPICIHEECQIKYSDGKAELKKGKVFLCRCGGSSNKPYCDGTHRKNGFQG